ncbi:MAG: trypsin-like peptidase domain-containing protein [Planctomycetaceae bacterium]
MSGFLCQIRIAVWVILAGLLISAAPAASAGLPADAPEALKERQTQLMKAVEKVRGAVVGVSDGMGFGSGVVVTGDGIVLTASHVVDQQRRFGNRRRGNDRPITITFPDGSEYRAVLLGKNADADAAVIRITESWRNGPEFPHAEMGRTSETTVGQWCFAMGHPGGYRQERQAPLRFGRVLSVGSRTVVSDCAILLGDSGGPLFDMEGRVIGIHSMITSLIIENRHVAIDCYHNDWDRLIAGDRWGKLRANDSDLIESGFFGVHLKWRDFVPEVDKVFPGTPAEKAGIQVGDVLMKIEGMPIADRLDLGTTLDLLEEDQTVKVTLRRKEAETVIDLTTGDDAADVEEGAPAEEKADQEREREIMEQLSENRRIGKFEKRTETEMNLYGPIAEAHRNDVVAIRDGGLLLCLGTVMTADGYILTKASEIEGAIDPEVILPKGGRFKAKELSRDVAFDLVLLKIEATGLQATSFQKNPAQLGQLAFLQDARGRASIPTVVSVEAHAMESSKKAFLGIVQDRDENGVRIRKVIPGGAAERNGLKEDDVVLSIGGHDVHDPAQLIERIQQFRPFDKVAVRYMRGDQIRTIELVLTPKFTNENPLLPLYNDVDLMGQFASVHSAGFPRAMQIDADVYPTKVGGPLLNLDGEALGIVIARADRYPTFVIPADSVLTVFEKLKAEVAGKAAAPATEEKK